MTKRKTRTGRRLSEERARYIPSGIDQPEKPTQTAKLFKNGRSQAVRLPKEFRFEGEEVYVRREGRSIVLTPKDKVRNENPWQDFFDALDSFDPAFEFVRDQPRHQQKRPLIESGLRVRKATRKSRS
jgi:antitoxin VapB